MDTASFLSVLTSFPTNIFFVPFVILFFVMAIDMVFDFADAAFGELDFFDFDAETGGSLLIPPVLSHVPLAVALCVTFFVGTVMSYYVDTLALVHLEGVVATAAKIATVPVSAIASLHVASWLLKPLQPLFDKEKTFATVNYIGMRARVHSSTVTQERGEVVVTHQGNEYLLDVVAETSAPMAYGDEVVILSKVEDSKNYVVTKI
ncbi:DUF1449 domain-containing protein [Thaumasiovibrio subtropicus]|uniref:DUF1449 domain-containing protein n=1 Tax=Thaumasiovibrio subtropicus TaxID=1891207 RepID=UPI000B362CA0|nr:DUF1449 domain-containing protein [Thaumasiovibrio subtropicus]